MSFFFSLVTLEVVVDCVHRVFFCCWSSACCCVRLLLLLLFFSPFHVPIFAFLLLDRRWGVRYELTYHFVSFSSVCWFSHENNTMNLTPTHKTQNNNNIVAVVVVVTIAATIASYCCIWTLQSMQDRQHVTPQHGRFVNRCSMLPILTRTTIFHK